MNDVNISVFPGQGAQYVGMGENLFDEFSTHTQIADEVLGYSIRDLCVTDSHKQLSKTEFTQPALYVVNLLHYLKFIEEAPAAPDILAGHSLGEYCALYAAGAFGFETGLRLVAERGRLMSQCNEGTMAAVVGLDIDALQEVLDNNDYSGVEIANLNTSEQTVLSGNRAGLEKVEPQVTQMGGRWHWLNVGGAFHSSIMNEAAEKYRKFLSTVRFYPIEIPVISNVTAQPYPKNDMDAVVDMLTAQLNSPVQWSKSMEYVKANPENLTEHGPVPVLSKMLKPVYH